MTYSTGGILPWQLSMMFATCSQLLASIQTVPDWVGLRDAIQISLDGMLRSMHFYVHIHSDFPSR
jgi:hypothetical protein